uniref:Uncharacterized protein n=1 Tax=Dictyoglomus turgidum TaxID=513050 RepID=A0A7C3WVP1_9BACT
MEESSSKGQKSCEERVDEHLKSRIADLEEFIENGDIEGLQDYHLWFDYVNEEEEEPYFRYQLSTGGPGDEFRFFCDHAFRPYRVEYWFLDWYDGANRILSGRDKDVLVKVWERLFGEPEYLRRIIERDINDL